MASEKRVFFFIVSDVVLSSCIFTRREALYILPGGREKLLPSLKFVIARRRGRVGDMLEGGVAVLLHRLNSVHCFKVISLRGNFVILGSSQQSFRRRRDLEGLPLFTRDMVFLILSPPQ